MKKLSYFALAATAILCACDPIEEGGTFDPVAVSQDVLSNGSFITFTQKDANGNPAADGNYITYTTNPATTITVSQRKGDANVILAVGPTGSFKLAPGRGSNPNQELVISVANSDRTFTESTRTINVFVKQDLDPEYKLLLGEAGKKSWAFAVDGVNEVWGNAGNSGNGAGFNAVAVDGKWWGVKTNEEFEGQMAHAQGDEALGALDAAAGSYMTFDEDYNIASFTTDGGAIRKGSYEIVNYDPSRSSGWQIGTLKTSVPAVLWPYSINENGKQVTEFDIMYLDSNHMTLVYTKGNGAGSWGEISYWRFINVTPSKNVLEGLSSRKWSWANDGVEVWGNAGNSGNGAGFGRQAVDGKWWGVIDAADLSGQLAHSGDKAYGDESNDAYMIFGDGKVNSYAADGSQIRGGSYEISVYPEGRNGGWELGKLTTSAPALLFPWSINEGGVAVTEFDIMYMDGDYMNLVYTKGNGAGSWGEITYWRFKGE